jgi:PAS domain S-box-containing protein
MTWNYAYTPQIWPPAFTALVLIALAVYSYRHRSVPGALPFAIALLLGALWMAGISLEVAAVATVTKIFWFKFQAACLLPIATSVTCFLLEYASPGRWLTRRNLILLSIPCLLNIGMILTNNLHHLAWQGFLVDHEVTALNGLGNWIFLVYSYGLGVLNVVILVWLFIHSPQHRWPAALIMVGLVAVRVVYALGTVQVIHTDLPTEVIAFWFQIPMYVIALFAFRIFDPIPLARQAVIEQLRDGMLVLDPRGRIVSLNPAAERILAAPHKHVLGKLVQEILPNLTGPGSAPVDEGAVSKPIEITIGSRTQRRCYEIELSPLDDFRGIPVGRLLLLHDVTAQKQARDQQTQMLWAQATLQEREQLADELHDGLSQNLAFLNLQAQAAQVYLQTGQEKFAQTSLSRLTEAAGQIQEDTRELIDHLFSVSLPSENFCATLRRILANFENQTGIPAQLELTGEAVQEDCYDPTRLPPPVAVQLVRISQEALVNVRKHARGAQQVIVELKNTDGQLLLAIRDDGSGFELADQRENGKHFGLQIMRQRAARIGGQVVVDSTPGGGTQVVVCVPLAAGTKEASG